jgi:glycerophosphoryl diester phosphodiesterase
MMTIKMDVKHAAVSAGFQGPVRLPCLRNTDSLVNHYRVPMKFFQPFALAAACCAMTAAADGPGIVPLTRAHAHNDYLHQRPLVDALSHGFRSVEADVWLTNGVLLVAHDFDRTSPERTLQKLYLDPLRAFVRTNAAGRGAPSITLLIDVKSDAETTWAALREVLPGYADILARFESNRIETNAVMAIISGNRAEATMRADKIRFAALDGRLPDLETNRSLALVPLISDNWTKQFQWRGQGPLPEEERTKLRALVQRTHAQGRRLRLWAAPDNPGGWKELFDAGVDLLNTDKLAELSEFLRKQ